MEDKLWDVSRHVENFGRTGSNEDTKVVSEPMNYIRDVVDGQVSGIESSNSAHDLNN